MAPGRTIENQRETIEAEEEDYIMKKSFSFQVRRHVYVLTLGVNRRPLGSLFFGRIGGRSLRLYWLWRIGLVSIKARRGGG